ncbi:glycosyltransferase family 1 protein, partial [Pseudomonas syringae pv. tagetis]
PYLPWPTTRGGKTREYHLLRNLAARCHRITLLDQSKIALHDSARAALEPCLERLIVIDPPPLLSPHTLQPETKPPPPKQATLN